MSSSCHWHAELRRLTAFWRRLQVSVGEALESAPAIDTAMMDLNRTGIVRPPPPVPPSFPLPKGPSVSWVLLVATAVGIEKKGADNNFWGGGGGGRNANRSDGHRLPSGGSAARRPCPTSVGPAAPEQGVCTSVRGHTAPPGVRSAPREGWEGRRRGTTAIG